MTVDFSQPLYLRSREARGIKVTGYQVEELAVISRGVKATSRDDTGAAESPDTPETVPAAAPQDAPPGEPDAPAPEPPAQLKRRIDEDSFFTLE